MRHPWAQLATTLHSLRRISHTKVICTILKPEAPFRTLEARLSHLVVVNSVGPGAYLRMNR